jgi:hypothetical protein
VNLNPPVSRNDMQEGWHYLEQFSTGIIEAAGRKVSLKHVLAQLEHYPEEQLVRCYVSGITNRAAARSLGADVVFTVRIKCVDKDSGVYLTAKGRASVEDYGQSADGINARLRIRITGIAAYRMETDAQGNNFLQALYNNMTTAEEQRAKLINRYFGNRVKQ